MTEPDVIENPYTGFEQGPIRPPSEAASLLLRVSCNCPWNRCTFCSVYKGSKFSLRPVEHVLKDIDAVHRHLLTLRARQDESGPIGHGELGAMATEVNAGEELAFYVANAWLNDGMKSIFIQDADSLVIKPNNMVRILQQLRDCFPWVERITSYARSQTIDRIKVEDLGRIAEAGLNRIHIGMESGSDAVLQQVQKGSSKAMHIRAGLKVKQVGMELSEYVMPGLGGQQLSQQHAVETAEALNLIDADFIRLRTLAIPKHSTLFSSWQDGSFVKLGDKAVAEEILLFLKTLDGISSRVQSDHILNLLQEVDGGLAEDQQALIDVVQRFLDLPPEEQILFQVGRRMGLFIRLDDLQQDALRQRVVATCERYCVTTENVDQVLNELMKRFI